MSRLQKWMLRPLRLLQSNPWPPSTVVAPVIDGSQRIEEENTPYYDPGRFYPTRLGEILNGRYQITTKVGYGSYSTVWLARDLFRWRWLPERYVAVKISAEDHATSRTAENELRISELISKANPRHEGWHFVRTLLDSFTLEDPSSNHICLVFEPLREPLWLLKQRFEGGTIPSVLLKVMVQMLLHGLDYLHQECRVIHADLKPDNILVRLEDESIPERSALDEFNNPLPQKVCEDRTIYLSRNNYGRPSRIPGIVSIVDFGFSVRGDGPHYGRFQAETYRAPEVILDAGWTYSADIWNLGVMLCNLLEGEKLFEAVNPLKAEYNAASHLALITALLGPPPKELLARGRNTSQLCDSEGNLSPAIKIPTNFSLGSFTRKVSGQDKETFLTFMSRMLKWQPDERSTAKELLSDPWLTSYDVDQ